MNIFFYISLFIFGTLFGSFASVIIHRLYSGEGGITKGRSHCFKCKEKLKSIDLFPIFSYLSTLGKCRYCKAKIPSIYPILEISTGLLFSLIGVFLIDFNLLISLDIVEYIKLFFWLSVGFITILYIFYDILFLEIHEGIMIVGVGLGILGLILNSFGLKIIPTIYILNSTDYGLIITSIIIGLTIIGGLYTIMLCELKTVYDILILALCIIAIIFFKVFFLIELKYIPFISGVIGALGIFIFFYLQILLSNGKALGGGDLRIGIMIGLILGISYTFVGMLMVYMVGSIISILIILFKKVKSKKKRIDTIVPFGPFIGIGFFLTLFLLDDIQNIIEMYFTVL